MAVTKEEILDTIASMSVLEVSELVKAMEEKFGVTAADKDKASSLSAFHPVQTQLQPEKRR